MTKTNCQSQPIEYKFKDFIGNIQSLDSFDQRPSFDWTSTLTLNLDRFDQDLTSVLKLDRLVWFQNSWVGMACSWLRRCLGDSTSLKRGPKKSLRTSQRKVFSSHCSSHLMSPASSLAEEARTSQFKQPRINSNINFRLSSPPWLKTDLTWGIGFPPPDSQMRRISVPSLKGPTWKSKINSNSFSFHCSPHHALTTLFAITGLELWPLEREMLAYWGLRPRWSWIYVLVIF